MSSTPELDFAGVRDRPTLGGVLVPLANSSRSGDNAELTIGEHKLSLLHARAAVLAAATGASLSRRGDAGHATASAAALASYLRCGGRIFPAVALPLLEEDAKSRSIQQQQQQQFSSQRNVSSAPAVAPSAARSRQQQFMRQQSFQLYAEPSADEDAIQRPQRKERSARDGSQDAFNMRQLLQRCHSFYSALLSPSSLLSSSLPPSWLSFLGVGAATPSSESLLTRGAIIRAVASHPALPIFALLRGDEVHFFDAYGASTGSAAAAAVPSPLGFSVPGSQALVPLAPVETPLASNPSVVQGWLARTLRHPLMSGACSLAWAPAGGQLLALGTDQGVVCLWQLSAPTAAAAAAPESVSRNAAASSRGGGSGGSGGNGGALMHLLPHPSLTGMSIDHITFSPCGRWMATASRQPRSGGGAIVVVWDVALALSSPGTEGALSSSREISRPFASLREKDHGVDVLKFSPRGDALLVASHRLGGGAGANVAKMVRAAVRATKGALGGAVAGRAGAKEPLPSPSPSPVPASASPDVASPQSAASALPSGCLTVWNTRTWTAQSWETAAPVTDAEWSTMPPSSASPDVLQVMLSLRGSSVVSTMLVPLTPSTPLPLASPLSSSQLALNLRRVEGLPPSRIPTSPEQELERYEVGGSSVGRLAWSRGGARLAVIFEPECDESSSTSSSSDLLALLSLSRDATESYRVLPAGVVRGPVCHCRGRVHPHSADAVADASSAAAASSSRARNVASVNDSAADDAEARLERKYDDDDTARRQVSPSPSDSDADAVGLTCTAPNRPTHAVFLRVPRGAPERELLAVIWKLGQVTFVPMYFA